MEHSGQKHIAIHSQKASRTPANSGLVWKVSITLDDFPLLDNILLRDPFNSADRTNCQWYLEKYVTNSPFSVTRAHETEELISAYPAALFKDLQLQEVLNKCGVDHGENLQILIDISEETDSESLQENTIHQLLWEFLENPALWKRDHVEVLVRRQINPQFQQLSKRPPDPPREDAQSSINILLVVARDTSQIESEYDDISPTMTCTILSRIRKLLKILVVW